MDITTDRENIWKRIKAGGPTSIIASSNEQFTTIASKLLKEFENELAVSNIKPLRVDCGAISDPVVLFKTVFFSIWELLPLEDQVKTEMFKDAIESTQETSTIDAILENFMPIIKTEMNINILLILEHFDNAVANLEEPDLMKVRGMSSHINLLTISRKPLEVLAIENKKEDYFCNQYKAYII